MHLKIYDLNMPGIKPFRRLQCLLTLVLALMTSALVAQNPSVPAPYPPNLAEILRLRDQTQMEVLAAIEDSIQMIYEDSFSYPKKIVRGYKMVPWYIEFLDGKVFSISHDFYGVYDDVAAYDFLEIDSLLEGEPLVSGLPGCIPEEKVVYPELGLSFVVGWGGRVYVNITAFPPMSKSKYKRLFERD